MYTAVAFLKDQYTIFEDREHPLIVSGCGHNRSSEFRFPAVRSNRPDGRPDYQLIYIASGKGHFYFIDGEETVVNAGMLVLYRPYEMQKYVYYAEEQVDVYWIHFTGNKVEEILEAHQFPLDKQYFYCGNSPEYQRILHMMIQELWLRKPCFEELLALLLQQFLVAVKRERQTDSKLNDSISAEIENATNYFHEHYNKEINIEEFAASRNMSISWFIRSFKQYHGKTPLNYILNIRITMAQYLLETSRNNVSEIASIVGYDDPMYFSKLFKRKTGLSPSEYRNRNQQ